MDKKLLYYCRINKDDKANSGVIKKCLGQVEGLKQLGWEVEMVWICNQGILLNNKLIYEFRSNLFSKRLHTYLFYYFKWSFLLIRLLDFKKYKFYYVRYELSHFGLISFFRAIKVENSKAKVYLEIPTYPYEKEQKGLLRKVQLIIDVFFRSFLNEYVDLVVHLGCEEKLFGIKTLLLGNGISLNRIPISKSTFVEGKLRLIAVGFWSYWHGLDRLIRGMRTYYHDRGGEVIEVKLTIIGQGPEIRFLKSMTEEFELDDYVDFEGVLEGKDLDDAFNKADIGVGDLASFRKGLKSTFSLKHREYCARGIPFLLATPDLDFPPTIEWVHYFKSSENEVSIIELIEFYQKVTRKGFKEKLRKYAEENLSWEKKMQPVIQTALSKLV